MFIVPALALACLLGWLLWRQLSRGGLSRPLRVLLTLLAAVVSFMLIYWGSIYLSIFLFQWNDPVTW